MPSGIGPESRLLKRYIVLHMQAHNTSINPFVHSRQKSAFFRLYHRGAPAVARTRAERVWRWRQEWDQIGSCCLNPQSCSMQNTRDTGVCAWAWVACVPHVSERERARELHARAHWCDLECLCVRVCARVCALVCAPCATTTAKPEQQTTRGRKGWVALECR
jgi:hypothetical protein